MEILDASGGAETHTEFRLLDGSNNLVGVYKYSDAGDFVLHDPNGQYDANNNGTLDVLETNGKAD